MSMTNAQVALMAAATASSQVSHVTKNAETFKNWLDDQDQKDKNAAKAAMRGGSW